MPPRVLGEPILWHLALFSSEKEFCWLCFQEEKSSALFFIIKPQLHMYLMGKDHEHQPRDPRVSSLGFIVAGRMVKERMILSAQGFE